VVTGLVFGLAGLHLITVTVRLVLLTQDYRLLQRVKADPHSVTASEALTLAGREHTAANAFQLVFLCYITAYLLWFFATRQTAERYGADRRAIVRRWTLTVWRVAILASVLLTFSPGARVSSTDTASSQIDSLLAIDRNAMLYLGGRFPVAGLLVAGVWVVRARVLRLAANPVVPRPTGATTWDPQPIVPLTPQAGQVARPYLRADAPFWDEVTNRLAQAQAPLPLLERGTAGRLRGRHDPQTERHRTDAGGPGDGLLGSPGSMARGRAVPSPRAGDPRRRHLGSNAPPPARSRRACAAP
jgi:hypothetical protein